MNKVLTDNIIIFCFCHFVMSLRNQNVKKYFSKKIIKIKEQEDDNKENFKKKYFL